MGTVMPVRNVLNDPGMFLPKGEFTGLMAFMMDARNDLPVDMDGSFPCLGSYDKKV